MFGPLRQFPDKKIFDATGRLWSTRYLYASALFPLVALGVSMVATPAVHGKKFFFPDFCTSAPKTSEKVDLDPKVE